MIVRHTSCTSRPTIPPEASRGNEPTMRTMTLQRSIGAVLGTVMLGGVACGQTYLMATTGVQNTYTGACLVSTCSGTIYDNGGAAGNYSPNVNAIFRTFCPNTAGMCMRATFTSFSMND